MQEIILFINQNHMLVAAFIAVLVLLMIIELIRQKQGATRISPQMATHLINHKEAAIVDIRNTEAYLTGHIAGSISIPLAELTNKYKKLEKYKSQPVIVVCPLGIESKNAADLLKKNGFHSVSILAGGIRGWKDADMPLIKD